MRRILGIFRDKHNAHNHALVLKAADRDTEREAAIPWTEIGPRVYEAFDKLVPAIVGLGAMLDGLIPDVEKIRPGDAKREGNEP